MFESGMAPLAVLVDLKALLETAFFAFLIGIAITVIFSFGLLGVARCTDMARSGRRTAALGYAVLAVVSFAVFGAFIAVGLATMVFN